ncbi:TRAP transporter small permease [Trueperella bialowiezensis]|uniref:2,3-diketo-L-gulonate TRAP transporter small permease protein yiaM n=1 Tax=Trueperella bialowiezensis TaxID=312285 RepID=A0A448PEV4_9ACTO|nr:TRAP transporter small permease [Trueperella bialowiezensis]VEI13440.1 2,3-diketo-L-gulonate TRAP transporter small permease protein yiaM [Trueperella bialowiezensis]
MTTVYNGLNRFLQILCIILFTLLVLATTWQVFSRLVLHSPVTWSEELAKMLFVWLSFLGSALVYGERGHMAVEFVARKFDDSKERGFAIFTHVVSFIFAVMTLVWGGWNAAMNAWSQNLTALPVNIGSVYLVMPIAGVAIALYAVYHIIEISAGRETNYPVPEAELAAEEGEKMAADAEKEAQVEQKGADK